MVHKSRSLYQYICWNLLISVGMPVALSILYWLQRLEGELSMILISDLLRIIISNLLGIFVFLMFEFSHPIGYYHFYVYILINIGFLLLLSLGMWKIRLYTLGYCISILVMIFFLLMGITFRGF